MISLFRLRPPREAASNSSNPSSESQWKEPSLLPWRQQHPRQAALKIPPVQQWHHIYKSHQARNKFTFPASTSHVTLQQHILPDHGQCRPRKRSQCTSGAISRSPTSLPDRQHRRRLYQRCNLGQRASHPLHQGLSSSTAGYQPFQLAFSNPPQPG